MKLEIGKNYLITTDDWFVAPDGSQYKSAWGEFRGTFSAEDVLGIKTNRNSTNWYASFGDLGLGGCQIHYWIETDSPSFDKAKADLTEGTKVQQVTLSESRIYNANKNWKRNR